jgi:sensor c-di-GMP phosphodiesterase-like protein
MTRSNLMRLAVVLAVAGMAASIALSMHLADRMARADVSARALGYARDVRARAEETGDQVSDGFDRLARLRGAPPCSTEELAVLRAIDLGSNNVQTMGRVVDGAFACTSYGVHAPPLALGPVDYVSPARVSFHRDASFAFAPGHRFVVLERDGFAAVVHKAAPLDVSAGDRDVALGVFARREGQVLSALGEVDARWLQRAVDHPEVAFVEAGRVVAVSRSREYNIVGVASLPASLIATQARDIGLRLVPLGVLGGGVIAGLLFLLARVQLGLPALIRSGLRRREFHVQYQPIVDLHDGAWAGAEVLLRWRRDGESIPPDVFIAAAEASGLIGQVTRRVTELVAPALARASSLRRPFYFSINLAAADLHDAGTPARLVALLRGAAADPARLRVEVTERGFARTDAARAVVGALRAAGIQVAIDDFGTGYSSLSYLESFELDCLKIDKRFVDTLGAGSVTSHVITHIIEMGHGFGLEMVAEGIEQEAQAEALRARGVRYGQGWLYARPMSLEDLVAGLAHKGASLAGSQVEPGQGASA